MGTIDASPQHLMALLWLSTYFSLTIGAIPSLASDMEDYNASPPIHESVLANGIDATITKLQFTALANSFISAAQRIIAKAMVNMGSTTSVAILT